MPSQAILFDLDGTLLDSLADIAAAGNDALSTLGQPTYTVEEYRQKVGYGADVLVKLALPADRQDLAPRAVELFIEYYTGHLNERAAIYDGVPALLDALAERGVPMAILSNKPEAAARPCVQQIFGRWEWATVAGHREDTPKKPDPAAAIRIAEELGIAPEDCLFVGDTKVDMQTAANAGMIPVGVLWGFRDRRELLEHGAKVILERPEELLEHLE